MSDAVKYHLINILQIVGFAVCGFVLLFVLDYIMKPESVDLKNIAGFYGEDSNTLDMVYVGGSAAFVYWQPLTAYEKFGITSYNFAADTIQAELYMYMTKEILKTQNPEVLVFDARAFQYRDYDQPPTSVAYRNVLTGTPLSIERAQFIDENINKNLGKEEDLWTYHFDIALYHTRYNELPYDIGTQLQMATGNYQNLYKGYYTIERTESIKKHDFRTDSQGGLSDETLEALDDLLNYLKNINKKVLFIVSPYEELKDHKKIYNLVEMKVKQAGFDFLDTNEYDEEMDLNYGVDFYNSSHVNLYGSDKYTNFVAKYLMENYNLVDHRDDNKYSNWNLLLDEWHEYKMNTMKKIEEEKLNRKEAR